MCLDSVLLSPGGDLGEVAPPPDDPNAVSSLAQAHAEWRPTSAGNAATAAFVAAEVPAGAGDRKIGEPWVNRWDCPKRRTFFNHFFRKNNDKQSCMVFSEFAYVRTDPARGWWSQLTNRYK